MILKNFLALTILALFICLPKVEAQIVTDKVPLLTFADASVTVYDSPNGNSKGMIPAESSLVLVKEIRSDGWAYGSYKPSGSQKRVYRWFKMAELQGDSNFENYTDQLKYDTDVLRTRNGGMYNGNAPSNEDVIVVSKRGEKSKIIFKADGDYYRMGWVRNDALKKFSSSNNDSSSGGDSYDDYDDGDGSY